MPALITDPHLDTLLFWIDHDARIVDVNDQACRTLGYRREEMRSLTVFDVDADFARERWQAHWRELYLDRCMRFRTHYRHRGGTLIPVEVVADYIEVAGTGYNCTRVQCITPQRQTAQALRESEQRLSLALSLSGQGLFDLDLRTGRTLCNENYARMLGYEHAELELTPELWSSWLHPEERDRVLGLLEDCIRGLRDGYQAELRLRGRDGGWVWVAAAGRVVQRDAAGQAVRIIGTQLDITPRKQAEESAQARERRLTQQNDAFLFLLASSLLLRPDVIDPIREITEICAAITDADRIAVWVRRGDGQSCFECLDLYQRAQHRHSAGEVLDIKGLLAHVSHGQVLVVQDVGRDLRTRGAATDHLRRHDIRALLGVPVWRHGRVYGWLSFEQVGAARAWTGEDERLAASMAALLLFCFEASERRQAEDALRESEERFRSIFEHAPLGVALVSGADARISATNPEFRSLLGYSDEQLGTMVVSDLTHPADLHQDLVQYRALLAGQIPSYRMEKRYLRRDGTVVWADLTVSAIRDAAGLPCYALGMVADITPRKQAETALRASQALLDHIIDQSPLPIVIYDRGGSIVRANQALLDIFGLADQPQVLAAYNLFQDQQLQEDGLLGRLERVFQEGEAVRLESRYDASRLRSGGGELQPRYFDLDSTLFPVRDDSGEITHVVLYHLDITERRAAEAELTAQARFLADLDRISRILTGRGRDADVMRALAEEILDIFQADRVFFLHPCDPDAPSFRVRMEVCRPEWSGVFADGRPPGLDGVEVTPEDSFRRDVRVLLDHAGPLAMSFAGAAEVPEMVRRHGIQSQMLVVLHPQADQPWLLGIHQCAYDRRWTEAEQRLFQAIAERVSDALSGYLLLERLQESEQRYRAVFESTHDAIIVHDDQGAILAVNDSMSKLYRLDQQEASTLGIPDLSAPENPVGQLAAMWARVARGDVLQFEWITKRPGDAIGFPVEVVLRAIQFGGRDCILANVRDITERKQAEAALRQSEERFSKAFRVSPAPMVISTIDEGRFLDVNDRWMTLLGYSRAETIGHTSLDIGLWIDADVRARLIADIRLAGGCRDAPVRYRTKSGDVLDVLWSAEIIRLDGQEVLLSLIHDVTERKRAEKALRLAELSIMRSSDAIFWITPAGRFLNVNDQACESLGYRRDELLGMAVWDIDPEFPASRWEEHWQRTRQVNRRRFETLHRRKDGRVFPVEVTANYIDFDGEHYDFAFVRDISEQKRAAAELERYREHLEELVDERTRALQQANAELRQAMTQLVQSEKLAALGNLVAGVAHELNTPLGNARVVASALGDQVREFAVVLGSGALRRSQLSEFLQRACEAVDLLERNSVRAADLIGHFKQVAVDQTSMRRRRFDLAQTVEEVLITLRPTFKRTEHRVEVTIPPELELDSYPGALEQVIANLVGNSLEHGFPGLACGRIRISAEPIDPARLRLSYADDGVGIAEELIDRIFEPFFTTRLGQGGSGLGLYIVYSLVTGALGGTIDVASRPGQGVCFTLTLPRTCPDHQTA